jgi:hypothetical protein
MDKSKLGNLSAELADLQETKNTICNREKEIALKVLKEHFGGDYTFLTEECKEDGDFDACPCIMANTMTKDSDPADAFITRIQIKDDKVLLDMYAYYSGDEAHEVNAEYEGLLDWDEIANCLLVAALND